MFKDKNEHKEICFNVHITETGKKTAFAICSNSSGGSLERIIFISFLVFYYNYHVCLFVNSLGSRFKKYNEQNCTNRADHS